eukprot:COSAG02_NODE_16573_length_1073_cov_1.599589_1_plen_85_part_10
MLWGIEQSAEKQLEAGKRGGAARPFEPSPPSRGPALCPSLSLPLLLPPASPTHHPHAYPPTPRTLSEHRDDTCTDPPPPPPPPPP